MQLAAFFAWSKKSIPTQHLSSGRLQWRICIPWEVWPAWYLISMVCIPSNDVVRNFVYFLEVRFKSWGCCDFCIAVTDHLKLFVFSIAFLPLVLTTFKLEMKAINSEVSVVGVSTWNHIFLFSVNLNQGVSLIPFPDILPPIQIWYLMTVAIWYVCFGAIFTAYNINHKVLQHVETWLSLYCALNLILIAINVSPPPTFIKHYIANVLSISMNSESNFNGSMRSKHSQLRSSPQANEKKMTAIHVRVVQNETSDERSLTTTFENVEI